MANRRRPSREAYRRAQLAARRAEGSIERAALKRINTELRRFARDLAEGVARLPGGERGVRESTLLLRRLAGRLERDLTQVTEQARGLSFEKVQEEWRKAGLEVARLEGIPGASMGAVINPPLSLLGAYENIGSAHHWRTLIQGYTAQTIERANAVVRSALLQGDSPRKLARELRPFLEGKGRRLAFNARRVAISEIHNARSEAEVQHFINDPYVRAVAWRLAPDRGTMEGGDECDVLATNDFYGLGPGIFPVDAVPLTPHPHDRCERVPVTQDEPAPKPRNLKRILKTEDIRLPRGLTKTRQDRIRRRMDRLMDLIDNQPLLKEAVEKRTVAKVPRMGKGTKAAKKASYESSSQRAEESNFRLMGPKNPVAGAEFAQSLREMERAGLSAISQSRVSVRFSYAEGPKSLARYNMRRKMTINLHYAQDPGRMLSIAKQDLAQGFGASGHVRSTFHHEIGHVLHRDIVGLKDFRLLAKTKPGRAAREVSRYATKSQAEFVAEVIAGHVDGRVFSQAVRELYRKYRGPKLNWHGGPTEIKAGATARKVARAQKPKAVVPESPSLPAPTPGGPTIGGESNWAASVPRDSTARDLIRVGVKAGRTNDEIMAEVLRRNPSSRVSSASIRKVRRELKRAGVGMAEPKQTLAAPISRSKPRARPKVKPKREPKKPKVTSKVPKVKEAKRLRLSEAEKQARALNYELVGQENPTAASEFVQALKELRRAGIRPGAKVRLKVSFTYQLKQHELALYNWQQRRMLVNIDYAQSYRRMLNAAKQDFAEGWGSSAHPRSTFHHELAHVIHKDKIGMSRFGPMTRAKPPADIAREVSRYATTSQVEFVAEVAAARVAGRTLSARVMKLYREYGGP